MTELDSSTRFDGLVESYLRYRPRYPQEIIPFLQKQIGLTCSWRVADVGSETGFLAERFVELGCDVTGVEPNSAMREAGDKYLDGQRRLTIFFKTGQRWSKPSSRTCSPMPGTNFEGERSLLPMRLCRPTGDTGGSSKSCGPYLNGARRTVC